MRPIPGSSVEHNKFCLSAHFRNVDPVYHERLKKAVEDLTAQHPELQLKTGRKVLEVRPKVRRLSYPEGYSAECC
jgi:trehalose 6-phosphate phosphatase